MGFLIRNVYILWENTLVLDLCVGLIYTFYSRRLTVAAGSNQKHFRRLLSHFHFEN